jgi:hypothetical protein
METERAIKLIKKYKKFDIKILGILFLNIENVILVKETGVKSGFR